MFKTSLVNHRHSFQHSFLIKKLPKLLGLCFGVFFLKRTSEEQNPWVFFENPEEQGAAWGELNPEQMAAHCCNNLVMVTATNLSFLRDHTPPGTGVRNQPWARPKLLPERSWWIRSAKLGSSPHQNIQSSLRPGRWSRRHTLSTSALRQRLKLLRMGSSSVTGNRMGADVGPCHT